MRRIPLDQVQPGDELAVDVKIQSEHPGTLYKLRLPVGRSLTRRDLKRLKTLGKSYLFIEDERTADLDELVHDEELAAAEEELNAELKKTVDGFRQEKLDQISAENLNNSVEGLIESLKNSPVQAAFTSLKSHNDYTAKHSLDVARLALFFVMAYEDKFYRFATSQTGASASFTLKYWLRDLGLGALLHDIGKWRIPRYILTKEGPLSDDEWEAMKRHPSLGANFLRKLRRKNIIRPLVRQASLHHHEKYGGGGYPAGRKENQIHLHGRIVAVCDVYSALTSNRAYRDGLLPSRALKTMETMQAEDRHFDPEILRLFLEFIEPFPRGLEVDLDDGSHGIVCDHDHQGRPIVRILSRDGEKLVDPPEIAITPETGPQIVDT